MEITILRSYTKDFAPIADMSRDNICNYCAKHNYGYIEKPISSSIFDQWYWHNIWAVLNCIHNAETTSEWIVWVDIDLLIMNDSISIESLLKDTNDNTLFVGGFYIAKRHVDIEYKPDYILISRDNCSSLQNIMLIHTGFFIVRNTKKSFEILYRIYRDTRFRSIHEFMILAAWDECALGMIYMYEPHVRTYWKFVPISKLLTVDSSNTIYHAFDYSKTNTTLKIYEPGDFILHAVDSGARNMESTAANVVTRKMNTLLHYKDIKSYYDLSI